MGFSPVNLRTVSIWLAVFLLLLLHLLSLDASSEKEGPQQNVDMVRMEIDEEAVSVDISFNGSFMSEVHCRAILIFDLGLAIDYVDLYFEPKFPDYISVELDKYQVRLTSEDPIYEFTANISVAAGTSSTVNPTVTLDGTARTDRGTDGGVVTDSISVRVLPHYSATVFFGVPTGSMDTGSSKTFILTIENTGNSGEHFILNVMETEFLSGKGIEVTFEESRVYVEEDGEREIEVKVSVSGNSDRGSYLIKISVWSERNGKPTELDNTATLTLNVDEAYINFIEGFIKDPIYLWVGLGILVVAVALSFWGILKLREHLLWKRTLNNIRNTSLEEEQTTANEVEEGP
jgi:hypothetical protein